MSKKTTVKKAENTSKKNITKKVASNKIIISKKNNIVKKTPTIQKSATKKSLPPKEIINNKSQEIKNPKKNKKFSKSFKKLLPSLSLAFVTSFMFFIYEPIIMYATNPNDFWFDIYDILPSLLLFFIVSTISLLFLFLLFQLLFNKLFKKPFLFYIIISIVFVIFVITYIQGNFLAGNLPGINGEIFNWRLYKFETVISIILWVVCFITLITCLFIFKPRKVFLTIPYISGAIFLMLSVSLLSTILTKNVFEDKPVSYATYENFNLASKNQNLFILLVDAVDSRSFNSLLKNNEDYKKLFKDFTYFDDTLSYYAYTRDCLPYIFNPTPNLNETNFATFSRNNYSNSKIFKKLKDDNYNMNFYGNTIFMDKETTNSFSNLSDTIILSTPNFFREVIRYDLYKYLPYPLKGKPHIELLNFSSTKEDDKIKSYFWSDVDNYKIFNEAPIEITDEKVFHFVHLEGAHIRFQLDENVNEIPIDTGTYTQKLSATFKIIKAYIERLKKAGVYDNSAIIVMADHGYRDGVLEYDYILDRFNPILYIKGINENHNKMQISDKPIAFEDLTDAMIELTQTKKSSELFKEIKYPRTRTLMYYVWGEEDHIVEYETDGKAWESDKMVPTGNVYDLKQ